MFLIVITDTQSKQIIIIAPIFPHFANRTDAESEIAAITLCLENGFIEELHKAKQQLPQSTYVTLLHTQLGTVSVNESDRLENRVQKIAGEVIDSKIKVRKQRNIFDQEVGN